MKIRRMNYISRKIAAGELGKQHLAFFQPNVRIFFAKWQS